jgi:hypothetical protein
MIDQTQDVFREPSPEAGESRMIGSRLIEGKAQKLFKGDSTAVPTLIFYNALT